MLALNVVGKGRESGIQVAFRSVEGTSALLFLGAKDTMVGAGVHATTKVGQTVSLLINVGP